MFYSSTMAVHLIVNQKDRSSNLRGRAKYAGLCKETRLFNCTYRAEAAIEQSESSDTRSKFNVGSSFNW
jgi:hypothetical protein